MTPIAGERDEKARAAFRQTLRTINPRKLIFLDETGVRYGMSRIYGYAPIGVRCEVSRSGKRRKNFTVVAAVSLLGGLLAPMVMDGGLTREAFAAWVEAFLVPELQAGDVVVMDNLRAHLSAKAHDAIEKAGATVLFLPT